MMINDKNVELNYVLLVKNNVKDYFIFLKEEVILKLLDNFLKIW